MAFNVEFYTFSKKHNSTAHPSSNANATIYSCVANEPFNIQEPVIKLKASLATVPRYNYCCVPQEGKWYWISSWECRDGLWYAYLKEDCLASFKTGIGNNSLFVFRSAHTWNGNIVDDLYPTITPPSKTKINLPRPWTVGAASASGAAEGTGYYVVGIIANTGTNYYAFTPAQMSDLLAALCDDSYYEDILTEFGASQYPEAKVAINPLQYITSCKWVPMDLTTAAYSGYQDWTLHGSDITGIQVGLLLFTNLHAYALFDIVGTAIRFRNVTSNYDITLSSYAHPQASRGSWLNYAPSTTYELWYPPFGLISLDSDMIAGATTLRISLTTDAWKCLATLTVTVDPGVSTERVIARNMAEFGCDVPLSNVLITGSSSLALASGILNASQAALSTVTGQSSFLGGAADVMNGIRASLGTFVEGRIPHVSVTGTQGSTANMFGTPQLYITHYVKSNDDLAGRGRPLCQVKQLSTIPGYIMADPDELSLPATDGELEEIRGFISGGFFYE